MAPARTPAAARAAVACTLCAIAETAAVWAIKPMFGRSADGLGGILLSPFAVFVATAHTRGGTVQAWSVLGVGGAWHALEGGAWSYVVYVVGGLAWYPGMLVASLPVLSTIITVVSFLAQDAYTGAGGAAYFAPPMNAFIAIVPPALLLSLRGSGYLVLPIFTAAYVALALLGGSTLALLAAYLPPQLPRLDASMAGGAVTAVFRAKGDGEARPCCGCVNRVLRLVSIGALPASMHVPEAASSQLFLLARCVEAIGTWRGSLERFEDEVTETDEAVLQARHIMALEGAADFRAARANAVVESSLRAFLPPQTHVNSAVWWSSMIGNGDDASPPRRLAENAEACRLALALLYHSVRRMPKTIGTEEETLVLSESNPSMSALDPSPFDRHRAPLVTATARALRAAAGACAAAAGVHPPTALYGLTQTTFGGVDSCRRAAAEARRAAAAVRADPTPSLFRFLIRASISRTKSHPPPTLPTFALHETCRTRAEQYALIVAAEEAALICDAVASISTDVSHRGDVSAAPIQTRHGPRGLGLGLLMYLRAPFTATRSAWLAAIRPWRMLHAARLGLVALALGSLGAFVPSMWRGGANGSWAIFTAGFCLQMSLGASLLKFGQRTMGTLLGVAMGVVSALLAPGDSLGLGSHIAVVSFVLKFYEEELAGASPFAFLAFLIVGCHVLVDAGSSPFAANTTDAMERNSLRIDAMRLAEIRIVEVLIGVFGAAAVTALVLPDRATDKLRAQLKEALLVSRDAIVSTCRLLRRAVSSTCNSPDSNDDGCSSVIAIPDEVHVLRARIWDAQYALFSPINTLLADAQIEVALGVSDPYFLLCGQARPIAAGRRCVSAFAPTVVLLRRCNALLALMEPTIQDGSASMFGTDERVHAALSEGGLLRAVQARCDALAAKLEGTEAEDPGEDEVDEVEMETLSRGVAAAAVAATMRDDYVPEVSTEALRLPAALFALREALTALDGAACELRGGGGGGRCYGEQ